MHEKGVTYSTKFSYCYKVFLLTQLSAFSPTLRCSIRLAFFTPPPDKRPFIILFENTLKAIQCLSHKNFSYFIDDSHKKLWKKPDDIRLNT